MSNKLLLGLAILLLGLSVLEAGAAPGLAPRPAPTTAMPTQPVDAGLLGMVIRDPWYDCNRPAPDQPRVPNTLAQDRMGEILRETGVRRVRLEFFVDSNAGGLATTFGCYDYFINTVAPANNLEVLGLLGFGLLRDRSDPLDPQTGIISTTMVSGHAYGGGVNSYMRDWLDRALAIGARYQGKIAAYEVLNEQNRLPPNGAAVPASLAARLHTKFYRFFKLEPRKGGDPNEAWRDGVQLLIGGLHPRGTLEPKQKGYLSDANYLRLLYGYPPLDPSAPPPTPPTPDPRAPFQEFKTSYGRYPVDGLGYHPYPAEIVLAGLTRLAAELDRIDQRLDQMRAVLVELGDAELPFWISEIGYDVGRVGQSQADQAAFMQAIYMQMDARVDVTAVFWFKYEDFPGGQHAPNQWGIVHIAFAPGPNCEGGVCYAENGEPEYWRAAYLSYRELAGLPTERLYLPMLLRQE